MAVVGTQQHSVTVTSRQRKATTSQQAAAEEVAGPLNETTATGVAEPAPTWLHPPGRKMVKGYWHTA